MTISAVRGIDGKRGFRLAKGPQHGQVMVRLILGLKFALWASAEDAPGALDIAQGRELRELLRKEVAMYGSGKAMSALHGQQSYALGMEAASSNMFRAVWAQDFRSFTINGDLESLDDLLQMASAVYSDILEGPRG
ncbi:hypothetical protein V8E36_006966 [Tilletia maclaganii]